MKITTQAELTANLDSEQVLEIVAAGVFAISIYGTAAPHIIVNGAAELTVEAWGSSQPRVVARGSSQPRVVAWESSQPRVVARGYAQLSVFGCVLAQCAQTVSVLIEGGAKVEGGQQVFVKKTTPQEWCDYYGVSVSGEVATLYKAVSADGESPRGTDYSPGLIPTAPDWDGYVRECGGGLHFSPTPMMAMEFYIDATRFMACPVALQDMVVHPYGKYPQKVKARACCAPTWEVDEDGEPIKPATSARS